MTRFGGPAIYLIRPIAEPHLLGTGSTITLQHQLASGRMQQFEDSPCPP